MCILFLDNVENKSAISYGLTSKSLSKYLYPSGYALLLIFQPIGITLRINSLVITLLENNTSTIEQVFITVLSI